MRWILCTRLHGPSYPILTPRYRLKDGAQGAEWTRGAHQLEHAGAALQTQVSPANAFEVTPMTCRPISAMICLNSIPGSTFWSPSNICPPPARLFHGLSCPALTKFPGMGELAASGPHPMRLLPLAHEYTCKWGGSCSSWFLLWSSAA